MKKLFLFHLLFFIPYFLFAQNIGVGISNPAFKLHVGDGTLRLDGPSTSGGIALSIGGVGRIEVDSVGLQGNRLTITEFGNIGIGTNNPSQRLHVQGNTAFFGNMGIGTNLSFFPLTFGEVPGDKISLLGVIGDHYGLGIGNSTLQIHTNNASSDVVFGYGQSASMSETMRIKGNGNVGIGVTDPIAKLDVAGTVRANQFKYSTPKYSYYHVIPAMFKAANSLDDVRISVNSLFMASSTVNILYAPVHLPQGATIVSMTVKYSDLALNHELWVDLMYNGSSICSFQSNGTPGYNVFVQNLVTIPIVDNQYSYYLMVTNSGGNWPSSLLNLGEIAIQYYISDL